ncbi:MAG: hypothetical protein V3T62_06685 [Alphaproteobacteria bacterium]
MLAETPLSFEYFLKLDSRAGAILRAGSYDEARVPADKIWIAFGPEIGARLF